jgi:hypothetical protein
VLSQEQKGEIEYYLSQNVVGKQPDMAMMEDKRIYQMYEQEQP